MRQLQSSQRPWESPGQHHLAWIAVGLFLLLLVSCNGAQIARSESEPLAVSEVAAESGRPASRAEEGEPAGGAGEAVTESVAADETDGDHYYVSKFVFEYVQEHGEERAEFILLLKTLEWLHVELLKVPEGYIRAREGVPAIAPTLKELSQDEPQAFYASAITSTCEQIVAHYHSFGYIGIFVEPHPDDIDPAGKDLRAPDNTVLRFQIWAAVVKDVRTVALGDRIKTPDKINNEAHEWILGRSPIQPDDILKEDALDDYVSRLSRFPGRRVDVSIASTGEPGDVCLDYLVAESKPTLAYAQIANTGTESTQEWRERFGLVSHHALLNDSILTFDYVTAGFDEAHAAIASYEAPFGGSESLRWRLHGLLSEFDASEVSITSEHFTGDEWRAGVDLIDNFYARSDFFADLVVGAQWRHIMIDNEAAFVKGRDDFFLPHVGLRLERARQTSKILGSVNVEWNMPGIAQTRTNAIKKLGRLDTDKWWTVLQWSTSCSFFLEPLLNPTAWEDPTTPGSSTLAHEIALSFAGQYAFDYRLIPQCESILGGLYTVRGYKESAVAGDTAYVGTAEYRCHIPRRFKPRPNPKDLPVLGRFKFARQDVFGRPDWDLIFRTFLDFGHVENNHRLAVEKDETLLGSGVGLELQVKRNLNIRCDWGAALSAAGPVNAGDTRIHLCATLLW